MIRWHNEHTRLAFHTVLEDWDDLDALALVAKDSVELAVRMHDSFASAFRLIPSPFLRHVCLCALLHVNFQQVSEQVLLMLFRQRNLARTGGPENELA
jgi:hypothetical protein